MLLIICLSLSFGLCAGKKIPGNKKLQECTENIKLKHKIAKRSARNGLGLSNAACRRNLFAVTVNPAELDKDLDRLLEEARTNNQKHSPDDEVMANSPEPCRYFAWDGKGDDDQDPSSYGMLVPVH
jgi:hypothetical protein